MSLVAGLLQPKLFSSKLSKAEAGTDTFKKEGFRFFGPFRAHLHSKFTKSANNSKKNFFKNSIWVTKNPELEFHADEKVVNVEKVFEKCHIKNL
jgi:hypothetical protein